MNRVACSALFAMLGWWNAAFGCSCRPDATLETYHQAAENILVARISGCAPGKLTVDGYCRSHAWTFETIEDLKGSNASVRPEDDSVVVSSCDLPLKVGATYLLFLRSGRTQQCSGTGSLEGKDGSHKLRDIEVLRAYRQGTVASLNPWYFTDSGWECAIDHQRAGIYIRFNYMYASPPSAEGREGASIRKPIPRLILRPVPPFEFEGATALHVNGSQVPLTRTTVEIRGLTPSFDVATDQAAMAALDSMSRPGEIVVSGKRASRHGASAEEFRAVADTAQIPELAAKFKECIAAHSDMEN